MKYLTEKIIHHEVFTQSEASQFIHSIHENKINEAQIAGILTGIQMRGLQIEEMKGFRSALIELSHKPSIQQENAIDLCGTGGDGKDTFNISTTTALVLASMGVKVIKHGNYGVSSMCGSSNVLEALGYHFTTDNEKLQADLDKYNICFLHAPLFHPVMKTVAPIRKQLAIRTVFNALGPLVNPVQPTFQLTGTYSLELTKMYQHLLKESRTDFRVIYGMDGYDEITLTDNTRIFGKHIDDVISHSTFSISPVESKALHSGKSIDTAAQILLNILKGNGTPEQNQVIAANTAVALQLFKPQTSLSDLFEEALEFINSGEAFLRSILNK